MSTIKWGRILQGTGYAAFGLVLLSVRAANFAEAEPDPVAMQASLVGNSETYSNQQVQAGQNVLSNLVLTRATYLLERAQQEPKAIEWLEGHRGVTLGALRAADTQKGGIWRGTAEDNAMASVVVESLAIELARTWLTTKRATPLANHSLNNYLASARMAGSNGRYDPATMELYLAALGLIGENVAPVQIAPEVVDEAPAEVTELEPEVEPEPQEPRVEVGYEN
jgi:hypothetical protein